MPFETHDPIAACAAAVQNINTFVARENDYSAESSGFVSVTQIQVRETQIPFRSLPSVISACLSHSRRGGRALRKHDIHSSK